MRELIRTKVFGVAFFCAYSATTTIAWLIEGGNPHIAVGSTYYGFPFTYYESHCFSGGYVVIGLVGNAIFACMIATGCAFAAANLSAKFSSPDFRRRWYL